MTKTVKVEIKSWWDLSCVLFSADVSADIEEKYRLRAALTMAVEAGANLAGAHLAGANLIDANLTGANLTGANLTGANLIDANLTGANLIRANLTGANLTGANLTGANLIDAHLTGANLIDAHLTGANLTDANLTDANLIDAHLTGAKITASLTLAGERPLFFLGPIGSCTRVFHAYITNDGLRLRAGCFFGTRDEFMAKLTDKHGENNHGIEYRAALALIDSHVAMWSPPTEEKAGGAA